jgi:hypothetical protein
MPDPAEESPMDEPAQWGWIPDSSYPAGYRWVSPRDSPPTEILPVVPSVSEYQALPAIQPAGADDELVEQTDNSLRPEDLALEQPPQDPDWRPADGDR